jgi:hypothetical protein
MGIKKAIAKEARKRLFSKDGVKRYLTEEEYLEEMKKRAKSKKPKRPKQRKPKHKDIEFYKDVRRRENRGE